MGSDEGKDKREQEQKDEIEKIVQLCDRLSADKKAQLVRRLLDDQRIQVIFGNSNLHADTIYQFNLADKQQMAQVLEAIADQISKESDSG